MNERNKIFNEIPQLIDEYPIEPLFESIKDFLSGKIFFFYKNFFLLDEDIYDRLLNLNEQQSKEMKKRNNFCQCFFKYGFIFVILNKYMTTLDKYVIEAGKIDKENKFILYYIFVFNTKNDYIYNFGIMEDIAKMDGGITNYLSSLDFNDQNIVTLYSDNSNSICGYIYRYSEDMNTNQNIKNFDDEFNNKIGMNMSINPNIINYSIDLPQYPVNLPKLTEHFHYTPMIGLQNVGATCYMNATLQCFGQISKLTEFFKYYPYLKNLIQRYKAIVKKDSLSESFKLLIENLWPNDITNLSQSNYIGKNSNNFYYKPYEFKNKISKMNPLFKGVQANDSKDLVNFIVMQLHEELNVGKKIINNNGDPPQTNELIMYNSFRQNYYTENKSIISDLFYGINETVYECSICKTRKFNFQIGFFYIFPLEEVRKYKIQQQQQSYLKSLQMQQVNQTFNMINTQYMIQGFNINNQNQNINSVTIFDCFDYNQRPEFMQGENAMYCNTCGKTENACYQNYICDCPEIMIIILNRGQGIQFKIKLEFTEFLNIQNYVRNNNNNSCNYKLIGVVTHMGENGANGHFIAFCRSPINDQWYNYNDDLCFPVNDFKSDVIDYAMPYILFYQKV